MHNVQVHTIWISLGDLPLFFDWLFNLNNHSMKKVIYLSEDKSLFN